MGWWTLGGSRTAPLKERVALELQGSVIRSEERPGPGETTIHLLVQVKPGAVAWVVALVRSDGMVKIMDETVGPYCEPCSPAFYREAVGVVLPAPAPESFAAAFRKRMEPEPGFTEVWHEHQAGRPTVTLSQGVRVF